MNLETGVSLSVFRCASSSTPTRSKNHAHSVGIDQVVTLENVECDEPNITDGAPPYSSIRDLSLDRSSPLSELLAPFRSGS